MELGAVFSVMIPLSKASSKDSKVADGCKVPGMVESESVPGWACWGVSAATTGWSCVVSICRDCGGDRDWLAGIAKVVKDQGTLYDPKRGRWAQLCKYTGNNQGK